ncbi:MAG: hypothetical protein WBE45_02745 [Terriglobales bacterium]
MSANSHSYPTVARPIVARSPDVLSELLHSLSQPLTGLRCSLELSLQLPLDLSIEQAAEQQQESVAVALEQTDRVIGMVQLMREYLDAEQPGAGTVSTALTPVLQSVIDELSSIAAVRGIQLGLVGACTATMPLPKARLRLALQYLIGTMIDAQPVDGKVTFLVGDEPTGAVLRVEGEEGFHDLESATSLQTILRKVRIAIASRVLESAGASLVFGDDIDPARFVLHIPGFGGASD